jgi:hypothetical protein
MLRRGPIPVLIQKRGQLIQAGRWIANGARSSNSKASRQHASNLEDAYDFWNKARDQSISLFGQEGRRRLLQLQTSTLSAQTVYISSIEKADT